jgi:hypothetical protein
MLKIDRIRIRFADWLPVPFEVATLMVTSLTSGWVVGWGRDWVEERETSLMSLPLGSVA